MELYARNSINVEQIVVEFFDTWAPLASILFPVLAFLSCWISSKTNKSTETFLSKFSLIAAEVIAFAIVFCPVAYPWKGTRFLVGIHTFASFMTTHGRIMELISKPHATKAASDATLIERLLESVMIFPVKFFGKSTAKISLKRLLYFSVNCACIDLCIYTIKEWIPVNVSLSNQHTASSLIGGIWVLLALDWAYCVAIMFSEVIGKPLFLEIRHRHPLVSTSMSEFWGIRWNPVIGRLLQDCFYKPVRRLGLSRPLCIIACFAGSATLHAFPQFLSTYDKSDSAMMGCFFLIQGAVVLIERSVLELIGWSKYFDSTLMPKRAGAHIKAHFQWALEGITILSILLSLYFIGEMNGRVSWLQMGVLALMVSVSLFTFCYIMAEAEDSWKDRDYKLFAQILALKFVGWIWMLVIIITTLPLFSVPILHSFDTMYPRSLAVGPLVHFVGASLRDVDVSWLAQASSGRFGAA